MSNPIYETTIEQLPVSIFRTNEELGAAAAHQAAKVMPTSSSPQATLSLPFWLR
jgi:hypothetical protein